MNRVRKPTAKRSLWTCSQCGRSFANRNQSHFCSDVRLDEHYEGREPNVIATFERLLAVARSSGPVSVLPEKTRIAFQVRMSFAAFSLRRRWIDGHVVLARRIDSPRFRRIDVISPRNVVHVFRLNRPDEVDAEVGRWLAEAYLVGEQRHLDRPRPRQVGSAPEKRARPTVAVQPVSQRSGRTPK